MEVVVDIPGMTNSTISALEQPPDALHEISVEIEVLPGPNTSSTTTKPTSSKGYKRKKVDAKDVICSWGHGGLFKNST